MREQLRPEAPASELELPAEADRETRLFLNTGDKLECILEEENKILKSHDIADLFVAKFKEPVNSNTLGSALRRLYYQGRIQYLGKGAYASAAFDSESCEPLPPTYASRVEMIFKGSELPLMPRQVVSSVCDDGWPALDRIQVKNILWMLKQQGRISRVTEPVPGYIAIDPHSRRRPPRATFRSAIEEVVITAPEAVSIDDIFDFLADELKEEAPSRPTVQSTLTRLKRMGIIKRVEPGVYAALEFDESSYIAKTGPRVTIQRRILLVLAEKKKRSFETRDVIEAVIGDVYQTLNPVSERSVKNELDALRRAEAVEALDRGVYAHKGFKRECYQPGGKYARGRVLQAMHSKHGKALENREVLDLVNRDGWPPLARRSINNTLAQLAAEEGEVQRLRDGIYFIPSPDAPIGNGQIPFGTRVMRFINAWDGKLSDLKTECIVRELEKQSLQRLNRELVLLIDSMLERTKRNRNRTC